MPLQALRDFFRMEAAGGVLLVLAAALAIIIANSPLAQFYEEYFQIRAGVRIGGLVIDKAFLLWVNDGLMAVFFLLVGLEIKREFLEGELASREQALLPAVGALGGMVVPALIYTAINFRHPENMAGWAIPAATDIAFALGVLSLLGSRVPMSLKVLLTAIAVLDDLGAIVIIAAFYTYELSVTSLLFGSIVVAALAALNLLGVRRLAPYVLLGIVLWVCVLKSGVHATLAGVVLALAIPISGQDGDSPSPLKTMEHGLHRWVAFGVLPIFGFANAGVSFEGMGLYNFFEPVTLGILLGLFLGKQIGIFFTLKMMIRAGFARMPNGASDRSLYGLACLCGIGFTMSLFIGGLAWEHADFKAPIRLGVLTGSLLSAVVGTLILLTATPKPKTRDVAPVHETSGRSC